MVQVDTINKVWNILYALTTSNTDMVHVDINGDLPSINRVI